MSEIKYVYKGKVRHCCKYCGKTVRLSEYEEFEDIYRQVTVDEKEYASRHDTVCGDCSVRIVKKAGRGLKKLVVFLLIVALIGGGLMLFKNVVFGSSTLYEWAMNKKLDKYEASDRLTKDYALFNSGADYTLKTLKQNTASNDYTLRYYTADGTAEVIKYTLGEEVFIQWRFKSGFDELSGKTYILRDGVIYENGGEKRTYTAESAQYGELSGKLNAYLPENCCCKGSYTSADELDDPEQYLIAHIIRGDSDTVLYETTEGKYYEKTADKFIYIGIVKPTEGDSVRIPEKSEYSPAE